MEQFVFIRANEYADHSKKLDELFAKLTSLEAQIQNIKQPDRKLTKKQAAKLIHKHENTIGNWMARGYLPFQRIGRNVYILESELLKANTRASADEKEASHEK